MTSMADSVEAPLTSGDRPPASHTVLSPRTFVSFASTMFAIDLISVGYGVVDLAFIAHGGTVMVVAVGLGDLVTLLYMAFFAGVVDVYAARLARAEGCSQMRRLPRLLGALAVIAMLWTVLGIIAAACTPPLLDLVGSNRAAADIAAGYVTVRMVGIPFALGLAAVSVTLRVIGRKRASIWVIFIGFLLNAGLDFILIYGPARSWIESPVMAVAAATAIVQAVTAIGGGFILKRHFSQRGTEAYEPEKDEAGLFVLIIEMLRTSLGVGLRQMNDYAATVVPFLLISRLGRV